MSNSYQLRRDRRRVMREQIDGDAAIADLKDIETTLRAKGETITSNELGALKLRAEIQRVKLAKVLPDLKSVEHDIGDGFAELSDTDLDQRITQLLSQAGIALSAPGADTTH